MKTANINSSNVSFIGNAEQIGLYDASNTNSGLGIGIILSTGDSRLMSDQSGNNFDGHTLGGANWGVSDPDLELMTGSNFNDALVLEFDFTSCGDSIYIEYFFASEEYNENVCALNTDAFGIFLSGPGINGPYSNNAVNISTHADGSPYGINTINNSNCGSNGTISNCENISSNWNLNSNLFQDNSALSSDPDNVEYDGFTNLLVSKYKLQCGHSYHIKIAIADAEDYERDSALLFKASGFGSEMELNLEESLSICEGGAVELNLNNSLIGDFVWSPITGLDDPFSSNPQASPTSDQWYFLSYSESGAVFTDSIFVEVIPAHNYQNITSICDGTAVTVGTSMYTNPGIYTDTLSNIFGCDSIVISTIDSGNSFISETETLDCVTYNPESNQDELNSTITYDYQGQTVNGCDSIHYTLTHVDFQYTFQNEYEFCQGGTVTVGNNVYSEAGTYIDVFQTSAGCDSTIISEISLLSTFVTPYHYEICPSDQIEFDGHVFSSEGQHEVVYSTNTGCDSIIQINIDFFQTEWDQAFEICFGSSVQIGQNIYYDEGTYTDVLTASTGCDSILHTSIAYLQPPLLPPDSAICEGQSMFLDLSYLNTPTIEWWNGSTSETYTITQPGVYWVTALLDSCWATDSINIDLHYNPEYFPEEKTLCLGEDLLLALDPDNGEVYWNTGINNSTLAISESGVYTAQIENACGNYTYEADIEVVNCDCNVFIPNSFTPNGDGLNDYFEVKQTCEVFDYELFMFDRWGGIIYTSNDPDDIWDGSISNDYEETLEIFSYIINYHAYNEAGIPRHQQHIGTVHIIR